MQIILTQQQIEEAIQNFLLSMMTLKAGTTFAIDFRATRGDAGYTAVIDMVSANRPQVEAAAPVATPTPVVRATASVQKVAKTQPSAPLVTADATPEAETPVTEAEAEAADEPATEEAPAEEAAAESTGGKRASIFANMKKPSGRVGQETEAA